MVTRLGIKGLAKKLKMWYNSSMEFGNKWKKLITSYFPTFHYRNALSNSLIKYEIMSEQKIKYSFVKGLSKTGVNILAFGVGLWIAQNPSIADLSVVDAITSGVRNLVGSFAPALGQLTVGGAIYMLINYAKVKLS